MAMIQLAPWFHQEIQRRTRLSKPWESSKKTFGVSMSEELGRALIIDFHRSGLECRPAPRQLLRTEAERCKVFTRTAMFLYFNTDCILHDNEAFLPLALRTFKPFARIDTFFTMPSP